MVDIKVTYIKSFPQDLADRFKDWKTAEYPALEQSFYNLVEHGQKPRALVISCCDSRVMPTALLAAAPGEFFVHRNIASLVPVYGEARGLGTSAAIEYAVTALKVPHIFVIGHSQCGGVKGCVDMCEGKAPALEAADSAVGQWLDILRPSYQALKAGLQETPEIQEQPVERQLEHEAVRTSLANLMSYHYVRQAVAADELALHGLWHDIAGGALNTLDPDSMEFIAL